MTLHLNDAVQQIRLTSALILVELVVMAVVTKLVPKGVADKAYLASLFVFLPKVFIMVYFAAAGVLDNMETTHTRVWAREANSYNTNLFLILYSAHSIVTWILELRDVLKQGLSVKVMLAALHHAVSIGSYALALSLQRFGFFCCLSGLCEVTNFPLTVLFISKTSGGGVAERMEKMLGVVLSVNGALLWITFLVFRILLFPLVLMVYFNDMYLLSSIPADAQQWEMITWLEIILYPSAVGILWLLSLIWFSKIHTGMMKILKGGKAANQKTD